ncbi:MAG: hypothetical protein ACYCRH_11545 [Acidiferrobacteraceae bacterium]
MKHIPIAVLNRDPAIGNADSAEDAKESRVLLERIVADARNELDHLGSRHDPLKRGQLLLQLGRALLRMEETAQAWAAAREAFDIYVAEHSWEGAAHACDILFLSDQPQSLAALGQGLWLAVTYPVDPELTVALLKHVVDETPPESDGAAVAAITAHYVTDLRAQGSQREDLVLYTGQVLTTVARRHSAVEGQQEFDAWIKRLELNDPALFLPRLRNVIDVLVQDDWWIDRERLAAELPA